MKIQSNGIGVQAQTDKPLLDLPHDDLRLTAAGDGRGVGVCGACAGPANGGKVGVCRRKRPAFTGQYAAPAKGRFRTALPPVDALSQKAKP